MKRSRWRLALVITVIVLTLCGWWVASQLPMLGAGGLLYPVRHRVAVLPPKTCAEAIFSGTDVALKGWRCRTRIRRGTLVYLHGIADNRASAVGVILRFEPRGFDVIAYDSRAHGESGGDICTYGFFEKQDLRRVLDTIDSGPIVLVGTSLGGAVALQEAAQDRRIGAVVAAETFSDLRIVATERAPFFFTPGIIERAFHIAEERGHFQVDAVSPEHAAVEITAPVLLIHGAADSDTSPDHSRRVFAALHGPKRLMIVPNAGHNGSLRADVWEEIERWIDTVLSRTEPLDNRVESTLRGGIRAFTRRGLRGGIIQHEQSLG